MGLIKRYINKKQKQAELWPVDLTTIDKTNASLCRKIKIIDNLLTELKSCRRKDQADEREQICDRIVYHLTSIKYDLISFATDYKEIKRVQNCYDTIPPHMADICLAVNVEMKLSELDENKKYLKAEFERIYKHFRSIAKGLEDVPMKYILSLMRNYFDFNNENFNGTTSKQETSKYRLVTAEELMYEIKQKNNNKPC